MSRTATRPRMKKNNPRHARELRNKARQVGPRYASDRTIYLITGLVGLFGTGIAWLLTDNWRVPLWLYVTGVAYVINSATLAIYRGKHIINWQQAMAKIPLRLVGYGTKEGKPLEAAHDQPNTRNALLTCLIVSLLIVVGMAVLLVVPSL